MYQFFTASKDATIYYEYPRMNTGLDEILEISKVLDNISNYTGAAISAGSLTGRDVSRFLIQFDTNQISASIAAGNVIMQNAELLFKECQAAEVPLSYTIEGYPVSGSWDMGIDTRYNEYDYGTYNEGVTWTTRTVSGSAWINSGSDYYTSSVVTATVDYRGYDLTFDVITPLNDWISGSIPNNGWVFKLTDAAESDGNEYGRLQFFSKETNTIYQPKIRIGWDDQVFNTGSLSALTGTPIFVSVKNLSSNYKVGSKPIIRVYGRERYPLKTYTNQYQYDDIQYLPSTTYYEVRDAITHEIIVPYSEYTKVSCDSSGNYFQLNLINWEVNRNYYINFKVDRNGSIEFFEDKNITFKVTQ